MKDKNIIRIINEEISDFDYLNNDVYTKEKESTDLLINEDFQKQFICDSLVSKNNIKTKVTDARVGGNDESFLTLEYYLEVEYLYDSTKEPANFILQFNSDKINVDITTDSSQGDWANYVAPSHDEHYNYIEWSDINTTLSTTDGDEINFIALKHAPHKIQSMFIREYTESIISKETIPTNYVKGDNIKNVPYC
jgi:hypothetical protein